MSLLNLPLFLLAWVGHGYLLMLTLNIAYSQPAHRKVLKAMRHARLTNSHEQELRRFLSVDLLILDDFCLDSMDTQESRDAYEILTERHRRGSVIVTSNRGPDEWLATFADPIRAQSAIDRFANSAFDLVIEGESYRSRLKPALARTA